MRAFLLSSDFIRRKIVIKICYKEKHLTKAMETHCIINLLLFSYFFINSITVLALLPETNIII